MSHSSVNSFGSLTSNTIPKSYHMFTIGCSGSPVLKMDEAMAPYNDASGGKSAGLKLGRSPEAISGIDSPDPGVDEPTGLVPRSDVAAEMGAVEGRGGRNGNGSPGDLAELEARGFRASASGSPRVRRSSKSKADERSLDMNITAPELFQSSVRQRTGL